MTFLFYFVCVVLVVAIFICLLPRFYILTPREDYPHNENDPCYCKDIVDRLNAELAETRARVAVWQNSTILQRLFSRPVPLPNRSILKELWQSVKTLYNQKHPETNDDECDNPLCAIARRERSANAYLANRV